MLSWGFCVFGPGEAGLELGLPAACRCGARPLPTPNQDLAIILIPSLPRPSPPQARELSCLWWCQGSFPPECPEAAGVGTVAGGGLEFAKPPSISEALVHLGTKGLVRPPGVTKVLVPCHHQHGPLTAHTGLPIHVICAPLTPLCSCPPPPGAFAIHCRSDRCRTQTLTRVGGLWALSPQEAAT